MEIDLLVRGICRVIPSQPFSQNIRVIRLLDIYLEHARIWYFYHGGEVAEKLGGVMKRLGRNIQVLSITHLPQIAALSAHQLVVSKEEEESGFFTTIREVSGEERVREMANMLTGAEMTEAALANARALLARNK